MRLSLILFVSILFSCQTKNLDGEGLFREGRFEEAVVYYSNNLEKSGNDPEVLYNRGRTYEEMGNLVAAIADYDQVLIVDRRHLNARLSLSKIAYENGDYSKSTIHSRDVLKLFPNNAQAHFLMARASHQLGFFDSALDSYNAAIALNDEFGEAYLYRGGLKSAMGLEHWCDDFKMAEKMAVEGAPEAVIKYCS